VDKTKSAEQEFPPGINYLQLIEKQTFSLEKFPQKEAFLVGKSIFNSRADQLQIQVSADIKTCKHLFNLFTPKDTVFSSWDFRYAWYLGYKNPPFFLTLFYRKKPVALLPLWYEKDKNQFRWFASWWMEENSFWVMDKKYIPILLAVAPSRTYLNAILLDSPNLNKILNLQKDEPKYILNLNGLKSFNEFLQKLKKKQRYNLKRDFRLINEQNPQIIINRFSDIEKMFMLSIKRFKQKGDESDFIDPQRRETFRQIIKQAKTYQPRLLTYQVNNQIAGIDLVLIYKNIYHAVKCAYDVYNFPGIGNFANLYQIDEAINLGCKTIDFLEVSYGWKEKLFTPIPLYSFSKGLKTSEIEP